MRLAIFGLSITSSWGNGHATIWRGLCREFINLGHEIIFFERDAPYYAKNRDFFSLDGGRIVLYQSWEKVKDQALSEILENDVTLVTSYCPDAVAVTDLLRRSSNLRVFYDLDTPITLARQEAGESVEYLTASGFTDYDLVLSYTGGDALELLQNRLGAKSVLPLYGSVDINSHFAATPCSWYEGDLSYLGTYAEDRQAKMDALFLKPAQLLPDQKFIIGGAQYPADFPWLKNVFFVKHLPPSEHPAFFSSSRLTLNITRKAMARLGYCPSGRLFEAAACETPMLTDKWPGLHHFFEPGVEILTVESPKDVTDALSFDPGHLRQIASNAKRRVLAEHTAARRAQELEHALLSAMYGTIT